MDNVIEFRRARFFTGFEAGRYVRTDYRPN